MHKYHKLSHLQAIWVLVTLKLGQGHRVSNFTCRLGSPISGKKMKALRRDVMKRRYEVITLTIHSGFRDLVTLKLGQGH